jgi:hypothetical protein
MPGALFFIEALILLLVLLPNWTFTQLGQLITKAQFGGALAAFLSFGALGFLFSIFHHCSLHQERRILFRVLDGFDHRPVIERLRKKKLLVLIDADTLEVAGQPSRREAWVILNVLWHERACENPYIQGANPRAEKLADIVHAIGTARWAWLFALLATFYFASYVGKFSKDLNDIMRFILMVGIAAILLCVHEYAYRRTSDTAEKLIAEILEDTLMENFKDSARPVRTLVTLQRRRYSDC